MALFSNSLCGQATTLHSVAGWIASTRDASPVDCEPNFEFYVFFNGDVKSFSDVDITVSFDPDEFDLTDAGDFNEISSTELVIQDISVPYHLATLKVFRGKRQPGVTDVIFGVNMVTKEFVNSQPETHIFSIITPTFQFVNGAISGGVNLSDLIQPGINKPLLSVADALMVPQYVIIDGTLNIDLPTYTFSSGSQLEMGTNSQIIVKGNRQLTVGGGCRLESNTCTTLWKGFRVETAGSLIVGDGQIFLPTGELRDARTGVYLEKESHRPIFLPFSDPEWLFIPHPFPPPKRLIVKKILITWVASFLAAHSAFSQKHDYIWPFGHDQGEFDTLWGGGYLDFNQSPIQVQRVDTQKISLFEVITAAISDKNGNLKYTTNGCAIVDNNQHEVENGKHVSVDDDPPVLKYCEDDSEGARRISRFLFVNQPGVDTGYVLVYLTEAFTTALYPMWIWGRSLNLAYFNEEKLVERKKIFSDTITVSHVSAVKHQNGSDWWVITNKYNTNRFFRVLIQKDSVLGPGEQTIGEVPDNGNDYEAKFSLDGRYYAIANKKTEVLLYNFDRETGLLSNYRNIKIQTPDTTDAGWPCSVAFSPNSRFMYVCSFEYLYQFDLEAPNIDSSKVLIAEFDGFNTGPFQYHYFYKMQNGPDCRIYMTGTQTGRYYHVIHSPDMKGTECDFRQHDLWLPVHRARNIPYFPSFRLGTNEPLCDSSITVSVHQIARPGAVGADFMTIYPNPANEEMSVSLKEYQPFSTYEVRVISLQGQVLKQVQFRNGECSIELAAVPAGMAFVQLWHKGRLLAAKKLIVVH